MSEVVVKSLSNLMNEVSYGNYNTFLTDEPIEAGGEDAGPDPYTLLLAALGSCISMTTKLYAKRKGWPLDSVTVRLRQKRVHAADCVTCDEKAEGFVHQIERSVTFEGNLSGEQIARLQEIAHKCPVHKTFTSAIVVTDLKEETAADSDG
ncbi:MAG TPA: OsmC family protein [Pyrinomonadaceae bacterium]|jgi:putative redox protein